jgi:zinc protease
MINWNSGVATLIGCLALQSPASGQVAPVVKLTDLKYPPLATLRPPEPERIELSNGMVVFLLEDHEFPTVTAAARIHTGGRLEPIDQGGLAALTGKVMRSGGTASLSPDQLDTQLDRIGAKVETEIGEGSGIAFMYSLKEDAPKILHILADVMQHPAFPQDKIDLARTEIASGIPRTGENMDRLALWETGRLIYGVDAAYSHTPSLGSLSSITREDVVSFYKRYFQPEDVVIGIWGDFDKAQIRARIEEEFGNWPRGHQARPETPPVDAAAFAARRGVYLANQRAATNAIVTLAGLGGKRSDPDFQANIVLARIISGRLRSRIRSNEGLAYTVYAVWSAQFDYPGMCLVRSDTKRDQILKVVNILNEELSSITQNEVSDEDLLFAKDFILKGSAFDFDSVDRIVSRFVDYQYFGYRRDYIADFHDKISRITKSDLLRLARKYWNPKQLTFLIVGDVTGLEKPMSAFGSVKLIDIP